VIILPVVASAIGCSPPPQVKPPGAASGPIPDATDSQAGGDKAASLVEAQRAAGAQDEGWNTYTPDDFQIGHGATVRYSANGCIERQPVLDYLSGHDFKAAATTLLQTRGCVHLPPGTSVDVIDSDHDKLIEVRTQPGQPAYWMVAGVFRPADPAVVAAAQVVSHSVV
jgi:hypothetical protein